MALAVAQLARRQTFERFGNGRDVLRGVAAAATGDIDQAGAGKLTEVTGHVVWAKIESCFRERIRQAGIRVAGDGDVGLLRELLKKRVHEIGTEGAVEPYRQRFDVLHCVPEGLSGLRGDERFTAATNGCGDHDGKFLLLLIKDFADGDEGGFGVERVEDCFDEKQVNSASNEGADLVGIGDRKSTRLNS